MVSFTGCRHQGSETKSISHDSACRAAISLSRGIFVGSSDFYIPISQAAHITNVCIKPGPEPEGVTRCGTGLLDWPPARVSR